MQETYLTDDLLNNINKEWEGRLLLSQGTNHSKGNIILFSINIDYELLGVHSSSDGRLFFANIKTEDEKIISLVNIYAPNCMKERKLFFKKVQKWITKFAVNENVIVGGDFNYTESAVLDRCKGSNNPNVDLSSTAYNALKFNCNLYDIWREMHPQKRQFTYLEKSRLDKFLISEECTNHILKSYIINAGIKTDHKCVIIELNFYPSLRGPGSW